MISLKITEARAKEKDWSTVDSRAVSDWRQRRRLLAHARGGARLLTAFAAALRNTRQDDDLEAARLAQQAEAVETLIAALARMDSWAPVGERFATAAERKRGVTHVRYYNAEIPEVDDGR